MKQTGVYTSLTDSSDGEPDVSIDLDGDLQIYPTGVQKGVCLFMRAEKWDELAAAVAAARVRHEVSA